LDRSPFAAWNNFIAEGAHRQCFFRGRKKQTGTISRSGFTLTPSHPDGRVAEGRVRDMVALRKQRKDYVAIWLTGALHSLT